MKPDSRLQIRWVTAADHVLPVLLPRLLAPGDGGEADSESALTESRDTYFPKKSPTGVDPVGLRGTQFAPVKAGARLGGFLHG